MQTPHLLHISQNAYVCSVMSPGMSELNYLETGRLNHRLTDCFRSTYKKIRRLYRQSQKYAASRMEQPELTQSELQLLRHVGFHGEVSQRHLADEMGVDKAMISRILQKLETKGYLVRTEDENDARSKNVRALPPALEIHSQGKGLSEQFFDQVTGDFSTEERELLDQLLGRMLEKGKALAAAPAPEKEVRP